MDYFTSQPEFNARAIAKVSKAATCLCRWVLAIDLYHETKRVIIPKTEALKQAEEQVAERRKKLEGKRATLATIQSSLQEMRFKYESALGHRDQLSKDLNNATMKVDRARTVLRTLKHERSRWEEVSRQMSDQVKQVCPSSLPPPPPPPHLPRGPSLPGLPPLPVPP